MLQIGQRKKSSPENPEQMLLDCHERIRNFTSLAASLASPQAASDADVCDAAQRVHRYYSVALPLHQQDEELSMAPRLEGFAPAGALNAMRQQHVVIDELSAKLIPLWQSVGHDAAARKLLRPEDVAALQKLWAEHLTLEEQQIFPGLRQLSPELQLTIAREMRARRT